MKILSILNHFLALLLISGLLSCDPDPELTYPVTYTYQGVEVSPSRWFVLTANAQNELSQVPYAAPFEAEIKTSLEEFATSDFLFQKIALLSEDKVKLTITDGGMTFDTTLSYSQQQDLISIHLGQSPAEDAQFYSTQNPDAIYLGFVNTSYSHKLANGTVDYSPIESRNSTERDVIKILNELRQSEHLMPGDTVAVTTAALTYKN